MKYLKYSLCAFLLASQFAFGEDIDRQKYHVLTVPRSANAWGEGSAREEVDEEIVAEVDIDEAPSFKFNRQRTNDQKSDSSFNSVYQESYYSDEPYEPVCQEYNYEDCCYESYTLSADWIFWKGEQDGLDYVRSGYSANGDSNVGGPGKVYDPDWQWRSGVRVELKRRFHCSDWSAFVTYTHYNTEAKDGVVDPSNSSLRKIWDSPHFFEDDISEASVNWGLNFNTIDIGLGKDIRYCPWLTLHPHFGFKGAWQKQDYHTVYIETGGDTTTNYIDHKLDFYGVGLRAGLDSSWEITPCLDLLGNVAISSVWGNFSIDRRDRLVVEGELSSDAITFLASRDRYTLIPALEFFIGVRWEKVLLGCYPIFSQIGWEQQIWFDMNQFIKTSVDSHHAHGNLTLHGLTWKFGWRY